MTTQTATREHPIIFNDDMIRAILAGRKTMTRRIAKPPKKAVFLPDDVWRNDPDEPGTAYLDDESGRLRITCPHGLPGDLLWCKETWQDYCPIWDGGWCGHGTQEGIAAEHRPAYRADDESMWLRGPAGKEQPPLKWRSGRFMPRWASRITLEITGVRVERLQSITEEDAIAEGIDIAWLGNVGWLGTDAPSGAGYSHTEAFRRLWDLINAKRGFSWESDPFCWVISFRRIKP